MQIGFNVPTTGPLIEPGSLVRIVTEDEALGFDDVTISDHIMVPRNLGSIRVGGESAPWVGDIRRLEDFGVTSVDVRLFGYGEAQTPLGTIDNMHRFRDGVLSKLA